MTPPPGNDAARAGPARAGRPLPPAGAYGFGRAISMPFSIANM